MPSLGFHRTFGWDDAVAGPSIQSAARRMFRPAPFDLAPFDPTGAAGTIHACRFIIRF